MDARNLFFQDKATHSEAITNYGNVLESEVEEVIEHISTIEVNTL